jgi:hypothetical protein
VRLGFALVVTEAPSAYTKDTVWQRLRFPQTGLRDSLGPLERSIQPWAAGRMVLTRFLGFFLGDLSRESS